MLVRDPVRLYAADCSFVFLSWHLKDALAYIKSRTIEQTTSAHM
jgi:hypothetical protein